MRTLICIRSRTSIFTVAIVPADDTTAAAVANGNFGTSPFFGQLWGKLTTPSCGDAGHKVQWPVENLGAAYFLYRPEYSRTGMATALTPRDSAAAFEKTRAKSLHKMPRAKHRIRAPPVPILLGYSGTRIPDIPRYLSPVTTAGPQLCRRRSHDPLEIGIRAGPAVDRHVLRYIELQPLDVLAAFCAAAGPTMKVDPSNNIPNLVFIRLAPFPENKMKSPGDSVLRRRDTPGLPFSGRRRNKALTPRAVSATVCSFVSSPT
jgi:hypothetical protein